MITKEDAEVLMNAARNYANAAGLYEYTIAMTMGGERVQARKLYEDTLKTFQMILAEHTE